jgi:CHAT domain-containing protein
MRLLRVRRAAAVLLIVVASLAAADATPHADEVAGSRLVDTGQHADGLRVLERVLAVYRRAGDRAGASRVAVKMSAAHRALGQLDDAVRDAQAALDFAGADAGLRLAALTRIGQLRTERREFPAADSALREAVALAGQLGDAFAEATALRALSRTGEASGQQREAHDHIQRGIVAADRAGDVSLRASCRAQAAVILLGLSRYDEALALAQAAVDIARDGGTAPARAEALFILTQAHAHVWNLERSAALWPQAIEAYRANNSQRGVAQATKQSVETWFARGDFERAVRDGEQAVALLQQAGLTALVPETQARLALSSARLGRLDAARDWSARARADLGSAPPARRLFVHNDLGLVAIELRNFAQAHADFARVEAIADEVGNVEYGWRAEWGRGRALTAAGDFAGARAALERAIGIVERLRQTLPEAGMRATFMTQRVGPYETLVDATMGDSTAPGDEAARTALHVAERARSRALADLLAEARARVTDPRLQAVRREEIAFGRRFSAAGRRIAAAADAAARTTAVAELRQLEEEYEALVVKIRREHAGYAALAFPRALTASEIAGRLAPDEALVEYLVTERRGYAWVVRRDGVHAYPVPGQATLAPKVRLLHALLAANDEAAVRQLGSQLYARLLQPGEPALQGARRLIVVPDGALQRLPFALLRAGDRWLAERHVLALAPSATILDQLRRPPIRPATRSLLALAAPDAGGGHAAVFDLGQRELGTLTHASSEVVDADARVGGGAGQTHVGPAATEQVLKAATAGDYRIVHFAAHAVVDEVVPRRSAVLLSAAGDDDGLLQVSEIANLSLSADLVVLAACRSNVGRLVRGEGLLSLSRAFMHAGARAVVATAWKVDDRETAWLMRELYGGIADGLAPDEALQRAQQRAIAAGGRRATPANWGAFLISGDTRRPIATAPQPVSRAVWAIGAVLLAVVAAIAWRLYGAMAKRAAGDVPVAPPASR